MADAKMKHFDCHFEVKATTDPTQDEPNIGKFEGYASTFGNTDRMDDVIVKGAFTESLNSLRDRGRQIRMLSQHNRHNLIGGFPSEEAFEDDRGLFVKGNINLGTQRGREDFALMKQGVLEDMSIGFIIKDNEIKNDIQFIKNVELMEISLVTEPANQEAQITDIKSIVPFQNLPMADVGHNWDISAAEVKLKEFSDSGDAHPNTYESAFLWHDPDANDNSQFKMQIGAIVDGQLKAVPRAIFLASAILQSSRSSIPEGAHDDIIKNLEQYYEKMGRESPFEKGFSPDEIKCLGRGDLVAFLRSGPVLSKNGAEYIAAKIHGGSGEQVADNQADGLRTLGTTLDSILKKD